ncbi:MAG: DUF3048 domain-containing protein [Acidimicrobiia bacterium]
MLRRSLFFGLVVVAACSGAVAETTVAPTTTMATTTTTTSTTTTTVPATTTSPPTTEAPGAASPVNGMTVLDPAELDRRVIAIKIDNHIKARPQSGIEQAETVYEILVEGGITRFIGLFHTADSDFVGPMRSARPTDIGLVKPLGATFFVSGMQPWIRGLYREAEIYVLEDVRPASFRIEERNKPHNLYADSELVREAADSSGFPDQAPHPIFVWGDLPGDAPLARFVTFDWSAGHKIVWVWTGTQYVRTINREPHTWVTSDFETEEQLAAGTVVVIMGDRYTARPSGRGTPVPAIETVGEGRALVFSGGRSTEGTWARSSIEETFTLTGSDGSPLLVPPGRLWITVFPDDRPIEWS